MGKQYLTHKKLHSLLSKVETTDGEIMLTSEDVATILADFTKPMLYEYNSWFSSVRELSEWLAILFKQNAEHVQFPDIDCINDYRSFLCNSMQNLSSRDIVELMEFFNPEEVNAFASRRKQKLRQEK